MMRCANGNKNMTDPFFLYVLSVYVPCGPKIGLIKSYVILSYMRISASLAYNV
jgi:hypothetical protein